MHRSEEWTPPRPVWPWETRKFDNRFARHPSVNSRKQHRTANHRGQTWASSKAPGTGTTRNCQFVHSEREPQVPYKPTSGRPPHPNSAPAPVLNQHTERSPFSAQPGVLYSDTAQMLYKHPVVQVTPHVQGWHLPQLQGGCDGHQRPLYTNDGAAFCAISVRSLEDVSRDVLLTRMVSLLNSEESSLLCVGVASDGRVVGAHATAGALARFVRGVIIVNQKFILPLILRGSQNKRCGVRCVPVRSNCSQKDNSWVVEIRLSANKQDYYNPYDSTNYYFRALDGAVSCVPFVQFCRSVVNTSVARYSAANIQAKYEEVMNLEKRLRDLQVSEVPPSEDSNSPNRQTTELQNPLPTVRIPTGTMTTTESSSNEANAGNYKPRKQPPDTDAQHLCELCWLCDCPLDSY